MALIEQVTLIHTQVNLLNLPYHVILSAWAKAQRSHALRLDGTCPATGRVPGENDGGGRVKQKGEKQWLLYL